MKLNKDRISRLQRLAETLKLLPKEQSYYILHELDKDITFDRGALEFIASQFISLKGLISELSGKELALILSDFEAHVLSELSLELNNSEKEIVRKAVGETRYEDMIQEGFSNSPDNILSSAYAQATTQLLEALKKEISLGRVFYDGVATLLSVPDCRQYEKAAQQTEIVFSTLSPFVGPGEGIALFIYAPTLAGANISLSMQGQAARYWKDEKWSFPVTLDAKGFFFQKVFPQTGTRHTQIIAFFPGYGELYRSIWYAGKTRSSISIEFFDIIKESHEYTIAFSVLSLQTPDVSVSAEVFCSHCGIRIDAQRLQLEAGRGKLRLRRDSIERHKHDLFIHFNVNEKSQVMSRLSISALENSSLETVPGSKGDHVDHRKPVVMQVPLERAQPWFAHVSTSHSVDHKLRQIFIGAALEFYGKLKSKPGAQTMLDKRSFEDNFYIFQEKKEEYKFISGQYRDQITYEPEEMEILSDLYFTFYTFENNGLEPVYHYRSIRQNSPMVVPFLPHYLNEGDTVSTSIGYFLPEQTELLITSGGLKKEILKGIGSTPLHLTFGQPVLLEAQSLGFKQEIHIPPRKLKMAQWKYVPPGAILDPPGQDNVIILYPGAADLVASFLDKTLMDYPWGCSEQTSAKLTGLAFLLAETKSNMSPQILIKLIDKGTDVLLGFRNKSGHYSLFNDHTASASSLVFSNLFALGNLKESIQNKVPRLFTLFDELHLLLGPQKSETSLPPHMLEMERILVQASTKLQCINGALSLYKTEYESLCSLASRLSSLLLIENYDSMEIFDKKSKIEQKVESSGIKKWLETLKLKKPHYKIITANQTRILSPALEKLLPVSGPSHWVNSFMATMESIGFLNLLQTISQNAATWEYTQNGSSYIITEATVLKNSIQVKSANTFVHCVTDLKQNKGLSDVTVTISTLRLRPGQVAQLIFRSKIFRPRIVHLLLPAIVVPASEMASGKNPQSFSFECFQREVVISVKAIKPGKGNLEYLLEDMTNPSDIRKVQIGALQVVK
ncbi:MAG: hypothetical protein ABUK01_10495 [Leptospirales bacterium]